MNCALTPSDIIELLGIVASFTTSIIAIGISILTLRQNSQMIEESTRPNLQIYPIYLNTILYIVIKNFGTSEAYIDTITCNHKFTSEESFGVSDRYGDNPFRELEGAIFSPGYSVKCPLLGHKVANETFVFEIKYHSTTKKYESSFSFNPIANIPFADTYPVGHTSDEYLNNIARELRDIVKMKL